MTIRAAEWKDLETVADLLASRDRSTPGATAFYAHRLRREWALPGFALGEDNLVVEDASHLVGYGALALWRELVLVAADDVAADELLARLAGRARARGYDAVTISARVARGSLGPLLQRHPFELERETLLMWRRLAGPVTSPRLPEGILLRTFEQRDVRHVHRLLDEAYRGWDELYASIAQEDWTAWMTRDPEFEPGLWWIAERGGAVVGCALYWSSGWLKDVAVAPSERGRGLGTALVQQGLSEFARRGIARVGLKVDASNPTGAARLYERLGFATAACEAVWRLAL